jgi:FHA domain-containing protein
VASAWGIRRETEVAVGFQLRIEDGSYVQTVEVRTGALTVGKNPPAGLALASPGLSSRHAIFRQKGDRVELEALPTRVGVRLRGERVDRALLAREESVQVGWARITVVDITPADEAPALAAAEAVAAPAAAAPATTPITTPLPRAEFDRGPATQPVALLDAPAPQAPPAPAAAPAPVRPAPAPARHAPAHAHSHAHSAHHEPTADFVVISRRAVRVLPWWGISIGLHAVLVGAVLMVPKPPARPHDESNGTIEVTIRRTPEFAAPEVPVVETSRRAVDVARPDMAVPVETPDTTLAASDDPKGQGGRGATRVDESGLVNDDAGGSPWAAPGGSSAIGVGSGARFGSGIGTNMDETFGKDDAGRANAAAAGRLNGDPFTRALVNGLRLRTTAQNVKVVSGDYDKCEMVMTALGLQHGALTAEEIGKALPTQEVRAIFYDCTGRSPDKQTLDNLERWVKEGGFLFTSDWGIENVIEKAFPGYLKVLRSGTKPVMTPDTTITFTVAPGQHVLLAGLPPEAETSRWWLEDSSMIFTVAKPDAVEVLAVSKELETRYGSKVVAVTFPYGNGRVVHALGHMFQKEGNLRGAYAMQRLLLNFLYQAIRGK